MKDELYTPLEGSVEDAYCRKLLIAGFVGMLQECTLLEVECLLQAAERVWWSNTVVRQAIKGDVLQQAVVDTVEESDR